MGEPSDEKIELLVRSVLAAVDARLTEVRHELREVAERVEQRHEETTALLHDLERRVQFGTAGAEQMAAGTDPLAARMEQATQVLLERIEAMHQRNTIATNERFALINSALEQIRAGSPTVTTTPVLPALDAMSAPIRVGPITAQQPVVATMTLGSAVPDVPPPALFELRNEAPNTTVSPSVPVPPIVPTLSNHQVSPSVPVPPVVPVASNDAGPSSDPIDIGQLADLLSERLGQLSLPPRSP